MAKLFIPGPTDVHPDTLQAQTRPMIGHRSQEFKRLFAGLQPRLMQIFQTDHRVFVVASSGTGMWEGLLRNCVSERALICSCGAFGDRWLNVASANGIDHDPVLSEWGQPNTPDQIVSALEKRRYDTLSIVHNESSTGVENPIQEIAAQAKRMQDDLIILVDAVSSAGGVDIRPDEWGLDIVMTSSQKCFALPPGLALATASDRAIERAKEIPQRGWYYDLVRLEEYLERDATPATPAISLLYALDSQLDRILKEGLEARFARHLRLAETVQSWAEGKFAILAPAGFRSKTVTCLENSREVRIPDLLEHLASLNMDMANGYGKLRERTFRIGHLGETTLEDLNVLLEAIDRFLAEHPRGGSE